MSRKTNKSVPRRLGRNSQNACMKELLSIETFVGFVGSDKSKISYLEVLRDLGSINITKCHLLAIYNIFTNWFLGPEFIARNNNLLVGTRVIVSHDLIESNLVIVGYFFRWKKLPRLL
jgi:hypothetical protein